MMHIHMKFHVPWSNSMYGRYMDEKAILDEVWSSMKVGRVANYTTLGYDASTHQVWCFYVK